MTITSRAGSHAWFLAAWIVVSASIAYGQELLVNGGAEAGDLSGWVLDGSEFPAGDAVFAAASTPTSNDFVPYEGDLMFILDAVQTGATINSGVVARMSQAVESPPAGTPLLFSGSLGSGLPASCDPGRASVRFLDADGSAIGVGATTDWQLRYEWYFFEFAVVVPAGAVWAEVVLEGRLDCGVFIDTFFDAVSLSIESCGPADFAPPFGTLDFFDVLEFLGAFSASEARADLNGDLMYDFFDVLAFLQAFSAGCP